MTRDLRRYAKQTNIRGLIGFIVLLFLVGDGLIYIIYGPAAAISGGICIMAGVAPLLAIWLLLNIVEWIAKKANEE